MAYTDIMPEELRAAFQHALETFERGAAERWDYSLLVKHSIDKGICQFLTITYGEKMKHAFRNSGQYMDLRSNKDWRFPWPYSNPRKSTDENISNSLTPRIDFMRKVLSVQGLSW